MTKWTIFLLMTQFMLTYSYLGQQRVVKIKFISGSKQNITKRFQIINCCGEKSCNSGFLNKTTRGTAKVSARTSQDVFTSVKESNPEPTTGETVITTNGVLNTQQPIENTSTDITSSSDALPTGSLPQETMQNTTPVPELPTSAQTLPPETSPSNTNPAVAETSPAPTETTTLITTTTIITTTTTVTTTTTLPPTTTSSCICPTLTCATENQKKDEAIKWISANGVFRPACKKQYFVSTASLTRDNAAMECCKYGMELLNINSQTELGCLDAMNKGNFSLVLTMKKI
ncbi:uncharacterized protein LOC132194426 [Neocloeon triangulifer]|uniref:uncharacterized protein LOC132194426 n=1 Tax=Neocloeon triangulifer TaxID=2078957 RepID=UPI00286F02B5|nr:uncharacterized protein LOC132194426 [Neocloeon triangulifer]